MIMPAAGAFLTSQVLPRVGQAAMDMGGQYINNRFSANQGQTNIGGVGDETAGFIRRNNLQVNTPQQLAEANAADQQDAQAKSRLGRGDTLFSAALGQQQFDNALKRSALLDAQANAAELARSAVSNAASRAASNANMIGNALSSGLAGVGRL